MGWFDKPRRPGHPVEQACQEAWAQRVSHLAGALARAWRALPGHDAGDFAFTAGAAVAKAVMAAGLPAGDDATLEAVCTQARVYLAEARACGRGRLQ